MLLQLMREPKKSGFIMKKLTFTPTHQQQVIVWFFRVLKVHEQTFQHIGLVQCASNVHWWYNSYLLEIHQKYTFHVLNDMLTLMLDPILILKLLCIKQIVSGKRSRSLKAYEQAKMVLPYYTSLERPKRNFGYLEPLLRQRKVYPISCLHVFIRNLLVLQCGKRDKF